MSEMIEFIGLGNMGLPMAANFLAARYQLRVDNRSPAVLIKRYLSCLKV
ncbi:MAG: hypothetical protein KME13_20855 [Myxacorys californica WJT36-NPBG1]|nr:hypothetical protein [Myxacorys californica WJT36-NPBG1]